MSLNRTRIHSIRKHLAQEICSVGSLLDEGKERGKVPPPHPTPGRGRAGRGPEGPEIKAVRDPLSWRFQCL